MKKLKQQVEEAGSREVARRLPDPERDPDEQFIFLPAEVREMICNAMPTYAMYIRACSFLQVRPRGGIQAARERLGEYLQMSEESRVRPLMVQTERAAQRDYVDSPRMRPSQNWLGHSYVWEEGSPTGFMTMGNESGRFYASSNDELQRHVELQAVEDGLEVTTERSPLGAEEPVVKVIPMKRAEAQRKIDQWYRGAASGSGVTFDDLWNLE